MDRLAEDLLRELECPICMEYQVPPILQCKNGHNICNSCKPSLQNCPTCRDGFLDTRSRPMENVSNQITHPCKYKKSGCTGHFLVDFKEQHEKECLFSPHKCPFVIIDACTWVGPLLLIKEHVRNAHKFTDGDPQQMEWSLMVQNYHMPITCCAIFTFDELFFYHSKKTGSFVQMMVMFVGFEEVAKRYKYKVTIETPDGAQSMSACLMCSSYMQFIEKQPTFTDDSAMFHSTFYRIVITEKSRVPFKLQILQSPSQE